ncbi:5-(carboxyamino)imidazole ribonucleotide synthase [Georgenia sp. Z1344]|uniref:5-(carboxyamino)imidazole ribonucleotide synthase n=1 Tax=Georgenia sp. Z1344 TaxID=3416706 RepID=UPI003CFBAF98
MTRRTVAVIGGGQLARMMAPAALALDVHLRVLVESADAPTAQVVPDAVVGRADDRDAVLRLTEGADVLTFEHEHVPAEVLAAVAATGVPVRPGPDALTHAQDKIVMRERLGALGVPCPWWTTVASADELAAALAEAGGPVVVKTARGGYDGKGVRVVSAPGDVADWLADLAPGARLLVEEKVPFTRELAALTARRPGGSGPDAAGPDGATGEVRSWPVVETRQVGGVCAEVLAPAPGLTDELAEQARAIAEQVATGLGVTGVLAVEMFLAPGDDGERLLVNELAMRPHNSGHWTIDGAVTSQFEQHLRAVLDLPLGDTAPLAPAAVMVNLLGAERPEPSAAYPAVLAGHPRAKVHLYGKEVRPGRKLGHVTEVGEDHGGLLASARAAVELLHRA